jgi:hypothetical protein
MSPRSRRRSGIPSLLPPFENMRQPLLPVREFYRRMLRGLLAGFTLIAGSLAIGVVGYHTLGHLGWIDAILNASMILAGMGPVDTLHANSAKLFASAYAIFSGVMFLTSVGVLVSPIVHRFLHHFHVEGEQQGQGQEPEQASKPPRPPKRGT